MARRGAWILGGFAALGLSAGGWVWATWPESPPPPTWSTEYDTTPRPPETAAATVPGDDGPATYDLTARPADAIPSGTVVARTAPAGWSHLVIKSLPHVRDDQKAGLSELTIEKASWMFTAFVADVKRDNQRYKLRAIALGLGAKIDGRELIVTPDPADKHRSEIGWIGREILTKGYEIQRQAMLVIHGPTMGLLDTPVWFRCDDENRLVRYRYALLADTATGKLDVLVWRLGAEGGGCADLSQAILLKPDTIDPAALLVERSKVSRLGIPSDDAFAVDRMPPGRVVPIPTELRPLIAKTRFAADDAHALDTRLRKLIADLVP